MYNKKFFDNLSKLILTKGTKDSVNGEYANIKNTHNDKTIESIVKQCKNVAIRTGKTNKQFNCC
jgi:hypothetical protein